MPRMKLEFDLRDDEAHEHVRMLSGDGELAFSSLRGDDDPVSENAIGFMYNRVGHKEVQAARATRAAG